MNFRLALSTLESPAARAAAARWLLAVCALGYVMTLIILALSGAGLQRWFFALLAWGLFVYVPLRILLEAFQTIAPALRRGLTDQTARRADRYGARGSAELMVDALYGRSVTMPRIATPVQGVRARAGAVAVLLRLGRRESAPLAVALTRCLAAVDAWVHDLGAAAAREESGNIQARWMGVRAVIALAALTKVLIAAAADRGEAPFVPERDPRLMDAYLDACLDYCDDLALQVDAVPWTAPALDLGVPVRTVAAVRERWQQYCEIEPPAVEARTAFAETVTTP
ncbi:MAG: hypothetical protein ACRDFT_02230 [bacterium]